MNNKKIIKIMIIIIIIFGIICYFFNSNTEDNIINNDNNNTYANNLNNNINKEVPIYYEDNETINEYITLFNDMHENNKITSNMLSSYYHHGTTHKDQVTFLMSDFQVILTANYSNNISIYIDNSKNDDKGIKNLIKTFVKVLNYSITDEKVEEYINSQGAGSNIDTYDGIEFWTNKNLDGTKIEYIKVTGELMK